MRCICTHLIKDMSAVKFDTLADFLMEQYHKKGVDVSELIEAQIEKAEGKIDYDTAYEEVVADSMETMLADGRLVERLQELAKRNKSIVQKIADYFKELARKIRAVYEKLSPDSREGRLVAEMVEETERLQDLFFDALKDVSEKGVVISGSSNNTGLKYKSRDNVYKNATELSEKDLEYMLEEAQYGVLSDSTYIPLRRNTPSFFVDVVNDHAKGNIFVEDYPMAIKVEHLRQNIEEEEGLFYGNARPHGFSINDIITISRKMGDPSYIVFQKNGRYAEIVSFYDKRKKEVIVAVDFASKEAKKGNNYKYAKDINGYNAGYYNIVVTQYEPDSLQAYLNNNEVVYDKKEMNGKYQVGSGRIVTVTHDTPFIEDIVPQPADSVNKKYSSRNKAFEKTVERAVEAFGTTTDYNEAGFILPDGRLLRLTNDKHKGEREYDHRSIGLAYGAEVDLNEMGGYDVRLNKYLDEFVNDGGIRFDPGNIRYNRDALLQLSKSTPITREQENTIRSFIRWQKQNSTDGRMLGFKVDFGDTAAVSRNENRDSLGIAHLSYEGGQVNADRIISDIRYYYETGKTREASTVAMFHYSKRSSGRQTLVNALEGVVQSEEERAVLEEYKNNIESIEEKEKQLSQLREEINDMQFTRGERDAEFLDELESKREQARKLTAQISRFDKRILGLEGAQAFKTLISRERAAATRLQSQKDAKAKQRAARRREIAETRRKTLNIAHGIESLLSRETKNRNIKDGMKEVGRRLLTLSKYLFEDVKDNADIARSDIEGLDEDEKRMVARYVELSDRRDALRNEEAEIREDDSLSYDARNEKLKAFREAHRAEREAISKEISRFNSVELKDIFARERRILNKRSPEKVIEALEAAYKSLQDSQSDHIKEVYSDLVLDKIKALKEELKDGMKEVGRKLVKAHLLPVRRK